MSRWRIRWSSAGRVAAIAAAVLAAVAVLPSLLGGSEPPPLPPDVGLAPAATPELAEPPPAPLEPVDPSTAAKPHGKGKGRMGDAKAGRRAADRRRAGGRRDRRQRRKREDPGESALAAPAPSPPIYVYPVSPSRPEFGFER